MPSRRRCQTKDPAQKTIPTKSTHSPAPPRGHERTAPRARWLAARRRQQQAALLGPARVQDGIQVQGNSLVSDDLFGGAGTDLRGLSDRARGNRPRNTRDATQVRVRMNDATANTVARRVGRRWNRGNGPGACGCVGNLDGLGNLNVKDEGRHGTRLRSGLCVGITRGARTRLGHGLAPSGGSNARLRRGRRRTASAANVSPQLGE